MKERIIAIIAKALAAIAKNPVRSAVVAGATALAVAEAVKDRKKRKRERT